MALLMLVIAVLAGAALVVVFSPDRWRTLAMLGWVCVPIPVYVGVVAYEGVTRPPDPKLVDNAIAGFSIISSLTIVPWLLTCGAGFWLGFRIRRLLGRPAPVRAPPKPGAVRILPQPPSILAGGGWCSLHVGFENDGLRIAGHDVWAEPWTRVDAPALELPHPAHPQQRHAFDIYEVGDTRFAAGELSNGVWGFYGLVDPPPPPRPEPYDYPEQDITRRASPFGDLVVELNASEWFNTHWVHAPRVMTTAGEVLLDLRGDDWDAEVDFPAAGQVALSLTRYRTRATAAALIDVEAQTYEVMDAAARLRRGRLAALGDELARI